MVNSWNGFGLCNGCWGVWLSVEFFYVVDVFFLVLIDLFFCYFDEGGNNGFDILFGGLSWVLFELVVMKYLGNIFFFWVI